MAIRKATKEQAKLRLAISGPSGSGKTYTALVLAKVLGDKIGVIDTERGSASLYAGDVADFDVEDQLPDFSPERYVKAIDNFAQEDYPVLVVDSLSHAWSGEGGALDQVDRRRNRAGGKFGAWREVTPMHNALVEAILGYPGHIICTWRTKTAYVVDDNGSPMKVGLAPVQRDGIEYEFTMVGDMDHDHTMKITKSRCHAVADEVIRKPGPELAERLLAWLSDGALPIGAQIMNLIELGHTEQARTDAEANRQRLSRADRDAIRAALTSADGKEAAE